jgi:hypothetical protein
LVTSCGISVVAACVRFGGLARKRIDSDMQRTGITAGAAGSKPLYSGGCVSKYAGWNVRVDLGATRLRGCVRAMRCGSRPAFACRVMAASVNKGVK